jgi:hypothetical protein
MRRFLFIALLAACGGASTQPDAKPSSDGSPRDSASGSDASGSDASGSDAGGCPVCASTEACYEGSCIDPTASCAVIHMLDPNAPSAAYEHATDHAVFYCDMTAVPVVQYDEIGMGKYNGTYPDFSLATITTIQSATFQDAFIALFNHQGGMTALETWTASNSCVTIDTAGMHRLFLGAGTLVGVAQGGSGVNSFAEGMAYTFRLLTDGTIIDPPLAPDFFQTHAPSDGGANCATGENPAIFVKSH